MEKKGLRPFRFIKSPAGEGRSYAEVRTELTSLVPETQTPSPCESTLAVEFGGYDILHHRPLLQTSRALMHKV